MGLRHFDVQLIGGMALHDGQIAEMRTGEGKTLVAVLAGYLNAIPGQGVHVVAANDYLARRDCEQMGRVYRFMGLTAGLVQNGVAPADRRAAYAADVTYGTASEFGFDYLRDNMATSAADRVQRGHHFAIVDEVDSILIDEARTPLIISGGAGSSAEASRRFAAVMPSLHEGEDFEVDEAERTVAATEQGLSKVERALGLEGIYESADPVLANHLQQALQDYFRLYGRLSGMTGTAMTEAAIVA